MGRVLFDHAAHTRSCMWFEQWFLDAHSHNTLRGSYCNLESPHQGGNSALVALVRRAVGEREFFIDNLLVRIHFIIEMILVDRLCAMGVWSCCCAPPVHRATRYGVYLHMQVQGLPESKVHRAL